MRTVFLSSFLGHQQSPTSVRPASLTSSTSSSVAFAHVLGKLQKTNQLTGSTNTLKRSQLSSVIAQQSAKLQQPAARAGSSLVRSPRFFADTRLVNPPSSMLSRSRFPQTSSAQPQEAQTSSASNQKVTVRTYGSAITATSRQLGVEPALSLAVARAESGISGVNEKEVVLNPRAVSAEGAVGLFQLTAATGKEQLRAVAPHQTYNPFNATQNIRLGVNYLKEMTETFTEATALRNGLATTAGANPQEVQRLAVAAYNAGPGRVAKAQALATAHGRNPAYYNNIEQYLPRETQQYVKKVERFATDFGGGRTSILAARSTQPQSVSPGANPEA
jgi:soluble lytic murein transglycosylase-like protein